MSDYARVTALASAALDLAPNERAVMLDRECAGDAALHADVMSLLAAHERAGAFLESPAELDDTLDAGTTVGPYRVIEVLGEGGMGIVYLAEDTRLGRTVALKSITPRFTDDERWRERLRKEARAAAALTHPGIATVYALEEIDGRLYLATEHVSGETLRTRISRGPFSESDVRELGRQLAAALSAAHDRGVVHRDLKPENVMWTPDGTAKILDFGLAKIDFGLARLDSDAAHLTEDGTVFGTPAYMAPEQLRGETAGPPADLFALGVILAECSTGRHPFAGTSPAVTVARSLSTDPNLTGVAASLLPSITMCLAKLARDRFRSAHELRAALDGSASVRPLPGTGDGGAFWWWQFDQAIASAFSIVLVVMVWTIRDWMPPPFSTPAMLAALIGALAATTLRLHLLFTSRVQSLDAPSEHRRLAPWVKAAGCVQAAGVGTAGLLVQPSHPVAGALLIASAVVLVLVSLVIGPARANAAKLG